MKYGRLDQLDNLTFDLPEIPSDLSFNTTNRKPEIYIGLPVMSDPSYKGYLYPPKTAQKNFLKEYGKQFNTIEVNSTRYGMPKIDTIKKWADMVPDDFKFSFKLPQVISHRKNMLDERAKYEMDKFLVGISEIIEKVGTTYMLMPSYFKKESIDDLKRFIDTVPVDLDFSIEIRNAELQLYKPIQQLLIERNITMVITDTPGEREVLHQFFAKDELFVRFLGSSLHQSDFNRIDQWCKRIIELIHLGLNKVFFFIHQPAPMKYQAGILAKYMIEQLNKSEVGIKLKVPIDYSAV